MTTPYADQAQVAFMRNPLIDKYSALSAQAIAIMGTECAQDYSAQCSSIESSPYEAKDLSSTPPPPVPCDRHEKSVKSFGFRSYKMRDHYRRLDHGSDHHEEHEEHQHMDDHGDHMGDHMDHTHEDRHMPPQDSLRLVPLGYGPQGDACLLSKWNSITPSCQKSLSSLQDLRQNYWSETSPFGRGPPPPHGPGFLGIFLIVAVAISVVMCLVKCCKGKAMIRRAQMSNLGGYISSLYPGRGPAAALHPTPSAPHTEYEEVPAAPVNYEDGRRVTVV